MDVGLVTAFLGGALALLSPCAALLLPAFFASTLGSGPRLYIHAAVFFLGLVTILVPLGIGVGAIASVFTSHRDTIMVITSALLIIFGIMQIFGWGFDMSKLMPGQDGLNEARHKHTGLLKSFLLGLSSGVAGFCAGPILGAVLTLVLAQGHAIGGALLLTVYAAGMIVPLVIIAGLWSKLGPRGQSVLRGREFTVAGRTFHTTTVITGVILIGAGIIFYATNGLINAESVVSTGSQSELQQATSVLANPIVDILAIIAIALIALGVWAWRQRHRKGTSDS